MGLGEGRRGMMGIFGMSLGGKEGWRRNRMIGVWFRRLLLGIWKMEGEGEILEFRSIVYPISINLRHDLSSLDI